MTQFSFPTVELQGIGLCVTRRVLIERAGITSSQLMQFQNALVQGQDYFYMPNPGAGMACNYYRVTIIPQLAQVCPTAQAQQMAQEVTAFMGAPFAAPAALPSSATQVQTQHGQHGQQQYGQTYPETPRYAYQEPSPQPSGISYSDPRVAELGSAIARNLQAQSQMLQPQLPQPSATAMTQADLLSAARTLQSDAVGYVKQGFNLAATAQSQTAEAIRRSRPNVTNTTTHNTDQRAYTMLDYLSGPVNEMDRTQFALLASGIFCLVAVICYSTFSLNNSNQRSQYAPTSLNRGY